MTDTRIAAAVQSAAGPMETTGAAYILHADTFAATAEQGYEHPFAGYFAGRGGMIGDVSTEELTEQFFSFPAEVVGLFWEQGKNVQGSPHAAADWYNAQTGAWGEKYLSEVEGIERFAELGEKVVAAAPNTGAGSKGWAGRPRAATPAGQAAQVLLILREMRGEVHFKHLKAAGIGPKEAHLLNNPGFCPNRPEAGTPYAGLFGFAEPWPDVTPLKAKRDEVEEMTSAEVAEIYAAALSADEAEEFARIAQRIEAVACKPA
ncbi:MAG: helix-turn-helix domain-containing protein [Sporichthyaceae bacterium]